MIRLAYLSTDPGVPYGGTKGSSVHIAEMTAALSRQGAEILLLVAGRADGGGAVTPPSGITLDSLPGPAKGASVEERLDAEPARALWLESRLAEFGATFLYERLALHSASGSVAARRLGIPHAIELNAPLPEEASRYRLLERADDANRLEAEALSSADVVLPVSRPLATYALARGARRVEVVPNAVAVDRFPEPGSEAPAGPPRAVFTGTLRPWHGVDVVADAWRLLGPAAPPLLIVGDGPGRERLLDAGAEVTGTVAHDEIPSFLRAGDIGLAPYAAASPRYFSPLKLFEYLAAGLATVAGELPGVIDIVTPDSAVIVPPGSAEALAGAVRSLAGNADLRLRLARAGRALVAAGHTWDHRAATVLSLAGRLTTAGAGR